MTLVYVHCEPCAVMHGMTLVSAQCDHCAVQASPAVQEGDIGLPLAAGDIGGQARRPAAFAYLTLQGTTCHGIGPC